jgi:hypothetical protein
VVVAGSWWLWLIEQSTVMRHCAIAFVRVGNFTQFRLQFWIYSHVFHKLFRITKYLNTFL